MTEPSVATAPRVIEPEHEVYNASLVQRVDETESLGYFWVRFDGEPTPFPPGEPPAASDLLSDELEQFGRDRIYEEAVRAASP